MAGHSQFKNIMYRKSAQDARRAKVFGKLIRELAVAVRLGPDPTANPRLRSAIAAAKAANMPKDTMERAIERGAGGEDAGFDEIRYEGYGPGGVAIIVEALTDNRNRTAAGLRAAFGRHGGSLGETNSVSFLFDRVGSVAYPPESASVDEMFEAALDAGARDVESSEAGHEVICAPVWRPQPTVAVGDDAAEPLFRLLEALDDDEDVRAVSANYEVADEVMKDLSA